ncbi:caspase-1-like [Achroia grisella]|uniref:caspase-1-like n=1 Tax=Achroia grisella TaxID=688607 RepID=UPI0027D2C5B6|nr:caspase-1-like [Achroia grisella]
MENSTNDSVIYRDALVYQGPNYETEEEEQGQVSAGNEGDTTINNKQNINALSKYAATYELEKFKWKAMLIFHHSNFNITSQSRVTSLGDVKLMSKTFKKLGFTVEVHPDKSLDEIKKIMEKFTDQNFTDCGCIVVAILTLDKEGMIMAKDCLYSEPIIVEYLKVKNFTLVTKPRVVIIQACRPTPISRDATQDLESPVDEGDMKTHVSYSLPTESDILVLHSRYVGITSQIMHISWFIKILCEAIDKLGPTKDLESIITVLNGLVLENNSQANNGKPDMKLLTTKGIMPVSYSTLTRKLFLKAYEANSYGRGDDSYATLKRTNNE